MVFMGALEQELLLSGCFIMVFFVLLINSLADTDEIERVLVLMSL